MTSQTRRVAGSRTKQPPGRRLSRWMRHGCATTRAPPPPPPPPPIFAMSCHIPCVPHEGHMLRPMPDP